MRKDGVTGTKLLEIGRGACKLVSFMEHCALANTSTEFRERPEKNMW
jgi:hypothetical protein